jgi:two-component system response regulator HydG
VSTPAESASAPIRVLIIDDDEGHAEALADGLETENCVCRIAHSGKAGLELLVRRRSTPCSPTS